MSVRRNCSRRRRVVAVQLVSVVTIILGLANHGANRASFSAVISSSSSSFVLMNNNSNSNSNNGTIKRAVIQNQTSNPFSKIHLSPNHIQFLHMGKAGGGQVAQRLRKCWNYHIKQQHPWPNTPKHKWSAASKRKPHPYMIITLRDPVDRFVSAFYWRIQQVLSSEKKISHNETQFYEERDTLFVHYKQNATLLAEDLCHANTTATWRNASAAHDTIRHTQTRIGDWLDFDWVGERIFPVVVEPGAPESLPSQVDTAMELIHNHTVSAGTKGMNKFEQRRPYARAMATPEQAVHAASLKQPLSPRGERCMVHYFRKEYEWLDVIRRAACKTEGCTRAIQSILNRRQAILDENSSY